MMPVMSVVENVIPAKAGIQKYLKLMDPDFRRDDKWSVSTDSLRNLPLM